MHVQILYKMTYHSYTFTRPIRDLPKMKIDQAIFSYAMATGYLNIY